MNEELERLVASLREQYAIERPIGRGASATVFLATDRKHDRLVALKVLHVAFGAAVGPARFLREIRTVARLSHPHILPLFDSGVAEGRLYYTMPFIEGGTLRDRLRRETCLDVGEAVRITREVAGALDYAHRAGVVHRDVKPENIMLSAAGEVLVSDFGLAYLLDGSTKSELTESGIAIGTPFYMSPEQSTGERDLDGRSDVYSLASVLYEMLAGEPPFTGPNARAVFAKRLREPAPRIRDARETVPPSVEQALLRALARTPADRYATAGDFALALSRGDAAQGETVAPSTGRAARRFVSVGRAGALLAVVAVLGAGALVGRRIAGGARPGADAAAKKTLVVLPFTNLGEPEDQYFADGLTEEITSRLAGLSNLGVISRTSANQYRNTTKTLKQIGEELGAGYALEGSIRWERTADGVRRMRVTPQLIRVSDDEHLWAIRYDAELTEVLKVQAQIAQQVTAALDVALREPEEKALAGEGTASGEAYDYYLRGNDYLGRGYGRNLPSAVQLYEKAVEHDSGFARAWAKLSQAHASMYWFNQDRSPARIERAREAAERALALWPGLPEGLIALGYYHYWGHRNYDRALEYFAAAQAQQPNNSDLLAARGYVERRQGRWRDAFGHLHAAAVLDPRSNIRVHDLAETYLWTRGYAEAERFFDRAIALAPDFPRSYASKAHLYGVWQGDMARGRQVLHSALGRMDMGRLAPGVFVAQSVSPSLITADTALSRLIDNVSLSSYEGDSSRYFLLKAEASRFRRRLDRERIYADSARRLLEARLRAAPDNAIFTWWLALAYAHVGRTEDAIRHGRRATDLLSVAKDAYEGPSVATTLARIYMMAGDADAAVAQLEPLLSIPSWISPASLRADPIWAPLHGNARFRQLARLGTSVASRP